MALQPEVLLIDENYIKKYTWINGSVDPLLMYPAIYLSQDKYAQLYLGTDLYNRIKEDVVNDDVTGAYATLLDNYLRRMIMWWTMYEVLPHLYVKTDNGSLVIRTSEDTTPISQTDLQNYRDQARSQAMFYTQRMVDFLCFNSSDFPEYTTNVTQQIWSQTNVYPSNAFEISLGRDRNPYTYRRQGLGWIR